MTGEANSILPPYRYERPAYGSFGELLVVGAKVICHICGRQYKSVAVHAVQAHGITADEYREAFGLARGHALEGPSTRRRRSEHGHQMVKLHGSHLPATSLGDGRRTNPRAGMPVRFEVLLRKRAERDPKQSATKRRTVCARGHSMAEAYVRPSDGKRRCRICSRASNHRLYLQDKAAKRNDR
jgi:hypothetical protein